MTVKIARIFFWISQVAITLLVAFAVIGVLNANLILTFEKAWLLVFVETFLFFIYDFFGKAEGAKLFIESVVASGIVGLFLFLLNFFTGGANTTNFIESAKLGFGFWIGLVPFIAIGSEAYRKTFRGTYGY